MGSIKARGASVLLAGLMSLGLTGVAASPAAATGVDAQDTHRASIACAKPKGEKANYSWGDGNISVTVYFNNHCSHKVDAGIVTQNATDGTYSIRCMTTNGGTKGKKKFNIGALNKVVKIQKGCELK
ncbi:hypothetical protein [Actinokineospora iranica]|uniref:Uncharacterized protein n=1 Tax=Actinokineospora iranica TaxID=1271860 RepID=A0A1G6LD18_9PSEU|nr:hypothetical protein [Actinokineospora iranica]SDC41169.1 hypothetical protein SAMN05216174_10211 [Actinokineospora iranica]